MLIFLILLSIPLISIVWTTCRYGIGPVPTSPTVKAALIPLLPNNLPPGSIYELGAGWGSLCFTLADMYPSRTVIAIEVSLFPYLWMQLRQFFKPHANLKLIWNDFFKISLQDAALIVCYLYPGAMAKLEPKINAECPSAFVITHTFALPQRKPSTIQKVADLYNTPIYTYRADHLTSLSKL